MDFQNGNLLEKYFVLMNTRNYPAITIRLAQSNDLPAILAISNHYAQTTPANFAIEPETLESWQQDFNETHEMYPWLVAVNESSGKVIGFAKASPWSGRCAYLHSAEATIYIDPDYRQRGIGRSLYEKLLTTLKAQGYCTVLGGITLPNPASIALHEAFGMKRVAVFEKIGWKFDQWRDVGYWQGFLGDPGDRTPPIIKPVLDVVN